LILLHPGGQPREPVDRQESEARFHKAVAVARQQSAKSLELRATLSLARLWQEQDKTEAARQQLAAIYGFFTEGFDTADSLVAEDVLSHLEHDRVFPENRFFY
jgi:predicted ATPase